MMPRVAIAERRDSPASGGPAVGRDRERWVRLAALAVGVGLYASLPNRLILGGSWLRWVVPVLEVMLIVVLLAGTEHESERRRHLGISLIGLLSAANATALVLLIRELLRGGHFSGPDLVKSAVAVWTTNVICFALWFWEIDRGGPRTRDQPDCPAPDFLFPQMTSPEVAPPGWHPVFVDYLFVSFTNSTAFSPTDTMPLTPRAKLLMGGQAAISLLTVVLVAARAVNILSG
jgi:hypothetical protein